MAGIFQGLPDGETIVGTASPLVWYDDAGVLHYSVGVTPIKDAAQWYGNIPMLTLSSREIGSVVAGFLPWLHEPLLGAVTTSFEATRLAWHLRNIANALDDAAEALFAEENAE